MRSSDLEAARDLMGERAGILADIEELRRAIRDRSKLSGLHFSANRCVLEAFDPPADSRKLDELSNEIARLVNGYLADYLRCIEGQLVDLGIEIDQ